MCVLTCWCWHGCWCWQVCCSGSHPAGSWYSTIRNRQCLWTLNSCLFSLLLCICMFSYINRIYILKLLFSEIQGELRHFNSFFHNIHDKKKNETKQIQQVSADETKAGEQKVQSPLTPRQFDARLSWGPVVTNCWHCLCTVFISGLVQGMIKVFKGRSYIDTPNTQTINVMWMIITLLCWHEHLAQSTTVHKCSKNGWL